MLILLWDEESRLQTISSFQEFLQSAVDTKEHFKGVNTFVLVVSDISSDLNLSK